MRLSSVLMRFCCYGYLVYILILILIGSFRTSQYVVELVILLPSFSLLEALLYFRRRMTQNDRGDLVLYMLGSILIMGMAMVVNPI